MTSTSSQPVFTGPYGELLSELAQLVEALIGEHGTSYVRAGDDKVYALGGQGYVIVLDERKWQGLVELLTPGAAITIKHDESGNLSVTAGDADEKVIKEMLREGIEGLRSYYENRYWSTPRID